MFFLSEKFGWFVAFENLFDIVFVTQFRWFFFGRDLFDMFWVAICLIVFVRNLVHMIYTLHGMYHLKLLRSSLALATPWLSFVFCISTTQQRLKSFIDMLTPRWSDRRSAFVYHGSWRFWSIHWCIGAILGIFDAWRRNVHKVKTIQLRFNCLFKGAEVWLGILHLPNRESHTLI